MINFFFSFREMVEGGEFLFLPYDEIVELISCYELNDLSEEKVRNFLFYIYQI